MTGASIVTSLLATAAIVADSCPGDLNDDNSVDSEDLFALISEWGPCPPPDDADCAGDLTGNGVVGSGDLFVLLSNWGECPQVSDQADIVYTTVESGDRIEIAQNEIPPWLMQLDPVPSYTIVMWVLHNAPDEGMIQPLRVTDRHNATIWDRTAGPQNDTVFRNQLFHADGSLNINTSLDGSVTNQWVLFAVGYDASNGTAFARVAAPGQSDETVVDVSEHQLLVPAKAMYGGMGGFRGGIGCLAIRNEVLTLANLQAMYESADALAPLRWSNLTLTQHNVFALMHAVSQGPQSAGPSVIRDTRKGSTIENGNVHVYRRDDDATLNGNVRAVRHVTVFGQLQYGSLTDDYPGVFEVHTPSSIDNFTVGTSQIAYEMSTKEATAQWRAVSHSNSRSTRGTQRDATGDLPDIPYGLAQNHHTGFAAALGESLVGVMNIEVRAGATSRWYGFDDTWPGAWSNGTTNPEDGGLSRYWTGSGASPPVGNGRPRSLAPNASIAVRMSDTPGTGMRTGEPMHVGFSLLAYPGGVDVSWVANESPSVSAPGSMMPDGPEGTTQGANTTIDATTMTENDSYSPGSDIDDESTLALTGEWDTLEVGHAISILDGPGAFDIAEVVDVQVAGGTTTITLGWTYGTPPGTGSLLAWGPVDYLKVMPLIAPSTHNYKGVLIHAPTASPPQTYRPVLLGRHCWREPHVPGFVHGVFGRSGSHFERQRLDRGATHVHARIAEHLGVDLVLLHGASNGNPPPTVMKDMADEYAQYSAAQPIYVIDMPNNQFFIPNSETAWAAFAADQDAYPAVSAASDPRIGALLDQYAGFQRNDGAHPSVEGMVQHAEAVLELMAEMQPEE